MWIWGLDGFGLSSGIGGMLLFVKRRAFTKLDRGVQLFSAFVVWAIHIAVFVAVLTGV